MPSETQTQDTTTSSTIVQPTAPAIPVDQPKAAPVTEEMKRSINSLMNEVSRRISEANNILIALSSDPSVDDLAAAIGFSLYLDRIGKRATAIYSGATPNALEFLNPEDTFEATADTLQDFVIALSKEKADHLRYKLEGDFVKIFITPYKKRIDESDLDYSYGDYNVDLVIAMDVNNGVDLDSALREYGRIMHDATVINITNGNPGKFGEIEWSDKTSSSVSEMISKMLYITSEEGSQVPLEKEEATAFLTGIVAATDRFSKANTSPETMQIASKLMKSGADQQLIAKNITSDINNELSRLSAEKEESEAELDLNPDVKPVEQAAPVEAPADPTEMEIEHEEVPEAVEAPVVPEAPVIPEAPVAPEAPAQIFATDPASPVETPVEPEMGMGAVAEDALGGSPEDSLLADLKAAEASLAGVATEATAETGNEPVRIEGNGNNPDEKVIEPSSDFLEETEDLGSGKYSEMLEQALNETTTPEPAPMQSNLPPVDATMAAPAPAPVMVEAPNPALTAAPVAPSAPEINGVPEMNYNATTDDLLPPPPTPPVDFNNPLPAAMPEMQAAPAPAPVMAPEPTPMAEPALVSTPVPQAAPVDAPSAFQIPGM